MALRVASLVLLPLVASPALFLLAVVSVPVMHLGLAVVP